MPEFDDIFEKEDSRAVAYKGMTVWVNDKFPVNNGDTLLLSIKSTKSDCKQGFSIDIRGHCELNGNTRKAGKGVKMLFWEDTMPKEVELKVFTKKGFVFVDNMWEQVNKYLMNDENNNPIWKENVSVEYSRGAAMLIDPIEGGRRYRCNDGEPDEDFDDIIFTVKNLTSPGILDKKIDVAFGWGPDVS
ncbi:hypothetical protein N9Y92_04545 [Chlamydiales bacterium]|nr:hypothetical protein [Chlamydiales bacterium]